MVAVNTSTTIFDDRQHHGDKKDLAIVSVVVQDLVGSGFLDRTGEIDSGGDIVIWFLWSPM